MLRGLLDHHLQGRTRRDLQGPRQEHRKRVICGIIRIHHPARFLFLRRFLDDGLRFRTRLTDIGGGGDKFERVRAVQSEGRFWIRRFLRGSLPEPLAIFVEQLHAQTRQPALKIMIGTIPDRDAVNPLGRFEIHLPPRILRGLRVRCGLLVVIAIRIAINGPGGRAFIGDAALSRFAGQRDILVSAENLRLGQRQNPLLARQFQAHITGRRPIRRGRGKHGRDVRNCEPRMNGFLRCWLLGRWQGLDSHPCDCFCAQRQIQLVGFGL